MKKLFAFLLVLFFAHACSTRDDWDSGASKTQADQVEDQAEMQNGVRNQNPSLQSP